MKNLLFILCATLFISCGEIETYKSEHVLLDTDSLMAHVDGRLDEKIHIKDSIIHELEIHDSLDIVHIKELEDAEQKRVRAIRQMQEAQEAQMAMPVAKEKKDSIIVIRDTTYIASEPKIVKKDSIIIVRDTIYGGKKKKKKRKK